MSARGKVLVLGREDRAFLAVLRSLGRRGLEVHVTWAPDESLALHSRYVKRVHRLPLYAANDNAWKEAFLGLCRRERFDLVIPTNDASIIPLQAHRAELEPHARIYLLNDRAFDVCFDKGKTYALAEQLGVRVPRQMVLPLPARLDVITPDWYPLVLKPHSSFTLDNLQAKHFVRRVPRPEDLEEQLAYFKGEHEVFVQEHFHGTGSGIEGLAIGGAWASRFQHLRIHERRKGGADSYRGSIPVREEMAEAAGRMIKALDYSGVVMFEFKLNLATGQWVLLEINARFWASLPLAVLAGADYPYWLYEYLVQGRTTFPQAFPKQVYCRNWGRDLIWIKENAQAPAAERYPWTTVVREFGPALLGRESSDTLVLDDPGPGIEDLRRLSRRGLRKLGGIARRTTWKVPPVRWLAAQRARRTLRGARRVLFVCKGNICRSPFAEVVARSLLDSGVTVASAGYHPKSNRPCPENAVLAAREMGLDLTAHRSTILDAEMIRNADAIVVFDQQNFERVVGDYPDAAGRVHRIAALSADEVLDVRDPYGGSVGDFRRAYDRIQRAVAATAAVVAVPR